MGVAALIRQEALSDLADYNNETWTGFLSKSGQGIEEVVLFRLQQLKH